MIATQETINYGKQLIEFELQQYDRKTITIEVSPTSNIKVKAPLNKNKQEILEKVKKKAKWITTQQNYFNNNYKEIYSKKYVSGESFKYLGKQYRLKVINTNSDCVKLKNGYLIANCNLQSAEKLIKAWYKKRAEKIFCEELEKCYKQFNTFGFIKPAIKIRTMKKRWGSYNKTKNIITVNIDLIKTNKSCIDYILIHELCHCVYFKHDKSFYELLETKCKNWKDIKKKLEELNL